jgi:hypothetical protein
VIGGDELDRFSERLPAEVLNCHPGCFDTAHPGQIRIDAGLVVDHSHLDGASCSLRLRKTGERNRESEAQASCRVSHCPSSDLD